MADRSYIPVTCSDSHEPGMLQCWAEGGKVRFALILPRGRLVFQTEAEFAGGLSNALLLAETEARLQR